MRQKADKSSGAFFNKLLCIQKSTTGRMTLFSESGILSVKTGGQREIAQMEEQEKQRRGLRMYIHGWEEMSM